MESNINQQHVSHKKTKLAILVTSATTLIIFSSMLLISNLTPSELFASPPKHENIMNKVVNVEPTMQ